MGAAAVLFALPSAGGGQVSGAESRPLTERPLPGPDRQQGVGMGLGVRRILYRGRSTQRHDRELPQICCLSCYAYCVLMVFGHLFSPDRISQLRSRLKIVPPRMV